jgi:uncharacterized membrane protein
MFSKRFARAVLISLALTIVVMALIIFTQEALPTSSSKIPEDMSAVGYLLVGLFFFLLVFVGISQLQRTPPEGDALLLLYELVKVLWRMNRAKRSKDGQQGEQANIDDPFTH